MQFHIIINVINAIITSVSDPDPGYFPQSGTRKLTKAKTKFWEKFLFSTQKVGILFLFSTNQVGILLSRELLFGIIFKNK